MDQEQKEIKQLTEDDVVALQSILRSDDPIVKKVKSVDAVKSSIKRQNLDVPDSCITQLFEAFRKASKSPHSALAKSGLSALKHYHTRLYRQKLHDPSLAHCIRDEMKETLELLVEKMGDQKKDVRAPAVQALVTMHKVLPADVESEVRVAMAGKNSKAKEASMQWLVQMHQEQGLKFKAFVPHFVPLLEDADPGVRSTAMTTVIELYKKAPGGAREDLFRRLEDNKVRDNIKKPIENELAPRSATPAPDENAPADPPRPASRPGLSASVSSIATFSERPITPMPDTRTEKAKPSYLNTTREIDEIFTKMHRFFEGNESEKNWQYREDNMTMLRGFMAGNAVSDFYGPFLEGLRGLLHGIIKAIASLRTSLSKEGCAVVQDIAVNYGSDMDPMVELLMQALVKLSGSTKTIASQQANVTVNTVISRVTYTKGIMIHVTGACVEKGSSQRKVFAVDWLNTILKKEAHHKSQLEHNGGLELVEVSLNKCLTDANPDVRKAVRPTYWTFHGMWPAKAEAIFKDLPPNIQTSLVNDPHNPDPPKKAEPVARPGLGLSRSTMGRAPKPTLQETVMAKRKAAAAQNLPVRPGSSMAAKKTPSRPGSAMAAKKPPSRPGSAMAHNSPPRPTRAVSGSSTTPASTAAPSTATRQKPATSGGLSVAPVRPTRRRPEMAPPPETAPPPEMAPRPATAGPYSVRGRTGTEMSPPPKPKPLTPKTMVTTPKRTLAKARPAHKPTASESSIPTPTRLTHAKSLPASSPIKSPTRQILQPGPLLGSPQPEDSLSLITPTTPMMPAANTPTLASPEIVAPELAAAVPEQSGSPVGTPSRALRVYEDPLTAEQLTPRLTPPAVLEEKPVNEDAANLMARQNGDGSDQPDVSDKAKQHARLIESALAKIKAKTLDVHGFRKLQSILRDNKAPLSDDKFEALLLGLFDYLEDPQSSLAPEKVQDVKAQNLATVKLLLKKYRDHFQPHISKGLESLMSARAVYDARTHIVSGLELLADELVSLGDAQEIATVLTRRMTDTALDSDAGRRSLSMGLHVLKEMVDSKAEYVPTDQELGGMAELCLRCLESAESGVRMDAVQLCVALQGRVGDARFWDVMRDVKDDPKSLITYYIVKRQREQEAASGVA